MQLKLSTRPQAGTRPYDAELKQSPSESLVKAVHRRDNGVCSECGFRSAKYMRVRPTREMPHSPRDYRTVCTFCWQVEHIDAAARQRSGELVWMPELDQLEINRMFPSIYVELTMPRSLVREPLGALIAVFEERKSRALQALGQDRSASLRGLFDGLPVGGPDCLENLSDEFRLWPSSRLIVRTGSLEFNQFPQMLAYWRSRAGPLAGGSPHIAAETQDWLIRLKG
ncbi:MAG: hypothetical protein AAGA68_26860 [Pseudomonadota bacterium]